MNIASPFPSGAPSSARIRPTSDTSIPVAFNGAGMSVRTTPGALLRSSMARATHAVPTITSPAGSGPSSNLLWQEADRSCCQLSVLEVLNVG
jgi:hypothetical protein